MHHRVDERSGPVRISPAGRVPPLRVGRAPVRRDVRDLQAVDQESRQRGVEGFGGRDACRQTQVEALGAAVSLDEIHHPVPQAEAPVHQDADMPGSRALAVGKLAGGRCHEFEGEPRIIIQDLLREPREVCSSFAERDPGGQIGSRELRSEFFEPRRGGDGIEGPDGFLAARTGAVPLEECGMAAEPKAAREGFGEMGGLQMRMGGFDRRTYAEEFRRYCDDEHGDVLRSVPRRLQRTFRSDAVVSFGWQAPIQPGERFGWSARHHSVIEVRRPQPGTAAKLNEQLPIPFVTQGMDRRGFHGFGSDIPRYPGLRRAGVPAGLPTMLSPCRSERASVLRSAARPRRRGRRPATSRSGETTGR